MNLYAFILGSSALLIQLYSDKYREDDLTKTLVELDNDDNLPRIRKYDFIVVGGGAAGCVLANRLSVLYNVLLLEAGGTPPPATRLATITDPVVFHPSINYIYESVMQNAALENHGIVELPEGRMLGGSTSHSGQLYNRGSPFTYDEWSKVLNDSSWEYKNVLKYFKKFENYKPLHNPDQHGHGGLVTIETADAPILPYWLKAGAELGFQKSLDPNGPQIPSFSAADLAMDNGRGVSTYTAYIQPIEKSGGKLRIERYSYVEEILVNEDKIAYGVAYTRHGIPQIAHVSNEVIISCGSYGSPILLMKSGIGPRRILKKSGIPVVANLPVGETLYDHVWIPLTFSINDDGSLLPSLTTDLTEEDLTKYHQRRGGLSHYPLLLCQAFISSRRTKKEERPDWADIQLFVTNNGAHTPALTPSTREMRILVLLTRPKSKGYFSLNSTAYKSGLRKNEELALIDFNLFDEPSDVDVLLEGIQVALTTMENTTTFQELGATLIDRKHPGCTKFEFRTDEYWRCYIHQRGRTHWHSSGTCRMGYGPDDKSAVLDSEFNVLGMSNIRVVDASVMPSIPNTNTACPTIMMGEKAADLILKTWKGHNK